MFYLQLEGLNYDRGFSFYNNPYLIAYVFLLMLTEKHLEAYLRNASKQETSMSLENYLLH